MAILNIYYPVDLLGPSNQGNQVQSQEETAVVEFDTRPISGIDAIAQANFFVGMPHRFMPWLGVEDGSLEAEPYDDFGLVWAISATYTTFGLINNESDETDSYRPLIDPYSWSYQKVVTHDKESGDPIENPAGDPPLNPFIRNVPNKGWKITLREGSPKTDLTYKIGDINNSSFTMLGVQVPKYCAQLADFSPNPQYDNEGNYYSLNTYDIRWNFALAKDGKTRIGFKEEVLAAGYNELKTADKKSDGTRRLYGSDNEPISSPAKLGSNGKVTTTPYYQQWVVDDLSDFSSLGLPTNYPSFPNG
tara:strand:+ start:4927 stop:5838 length:912 start_codon:yes stop_codon:yes gene_type:complete